jgi:hypothetical protein
MAAELMRRGYSAVCCVTSGTLPRFLSFAQYCIPKGKSFRLGKKIILPHALSEEFRKLPDTILSADAAFQDVSLIAWQLFRLIVDFVRSFILTRKLRADRHFILNSHLALKARPFRASSRSA